MQKPRAGVHEVVEELFEEIGVKDAGSKDAGCSIVAKFVGVGRSTAYKWSDPDQDGEISFARVRLLTEHFGAVAAAQDLAKLAGGVFVQIDAHGHPDTHWHKSLREIAQDFASLAESLSIALEDDNDVDRGEVIKLKMIENVDALIAEAVTHRMALKRVLEPVNVVPIAAAVAVAGAGR